MTSGQSGARVLRRVSSVHIVGPEAPLLLAVMSFWEEACCVFVAGVLEAGLLVAVVLVGYIGSAKEDEVHPESAPFFVNSSLAPFLLLRRRLKSVADVLQGIRQHGFTQTRWDALQGYWSAVCRHGPCGPLCSLDSWVGWIHPDLHGIYNFLMISLGKWSSVGRMLGCVSGQIGFENSGFKEPSDSVVSDFGGASFNRCHFSAGLGILLLLLTFFLFCRSPSANLELPSITGRERQEVARAKKSTAGGLDGWAWNKVKALPLPWFSGLAILLVMVEATGV